MPHLLPIPPVLLADLPLLVGYFLTLPKTAQLFFGVDVEPELEQDCPEVCQLLLHPIDFPVRSPPLCLRAEPLHPLDQHAAVPRPVYDRNMPGLRDPRPEPPQVVMSFLDVVWGGDGDHFVPSRIQVLRQPLDVAPLSRRLPALVCND